MKFHAIVVLRLNELLEQAQEHQLETRSLELSTPQGTAVTLPPVASPART